MNREWVLNSDDFEQFLTWLDADRGRAGEKYEKIRARLIKIFTCRGCSAAADLADETINRVIHRVRDIAPGYKGDPAPYFYGVANKVHLEYVRRPETAPMPDSVAAPAEESEDEDRELECLEQCMMRLTEQNREMILQYYSEEKQRKIELRREMARSMGIALNALRIRAHRVRESLHQCVLECLGRATRA